MPGVYITKIINYRANVGSCTVEKAAERVTVRDLFRGANSIFVCKSFNKLHEI